MGLLCISPFAVKKKNKPQTIYQGLKSNQISTCSQNFNIRLLAFVFFMLLNSLPVDMFLLSLCFKFPLYLTIANKRRKRKVSSSFHSGKKKSILHIHSHREKSVKYSIIGGEENDSKILLNLSQSPITASDNTCFTVNEKKKSSERESPIRAFQRCSLVLLSISCQQFARQPWMAAGKLLANL